MSFALQKLWFLWGPICQFLILQNKQFGVLLRNLSPVPISLRLFPNFFSIVFSVSGFMCSSLFPLDFSIVQGDKNGSIYILLHANHLLTQNHLLKMLSSFHWMVLAPLQRSSDHRIYRRNHPLEKQLFFFLVFQDWVSLYSLGCPGTHSVDQAGLKLRNLPVSASQVAGIKGMHHQQNSYSTNGAGSTDG